VPNPEDASGDRLLELRAGKGTIELIELFLTEFVEKRETPWRTRKSKTRALTCRNAFDCYLGIQMTLVTISILEGLERGQTFHDLTPPVTIGREEDNVIQLNDERVSRVHAKLQEDRGQNQF